MSNEKIEELIDEGITLHDGSHSVSEDARFTRSLYDAVKEDICGSDSVIPKPIETYDILSEKEIDMLLEVVEKPTKFSEEELDKLFDSLPDDKDPVLMNFPDMFSWLTRCKKEGYTNEKILISRTNWLDQYIFYVHGSTFTVSRQPLLSIFKEGKLINYIPHIDVCYPNGSIGVWTPTQEDLFAENYYICEDNL